MRVKDGGVMLSHCVGYVVAGLAKLCTGAGDGRSTSGVPGGRSSISRAVVVSESFGPTPIPGEADSGPEMGAGGGAMSGGAGRTSSSKLRPTMAATAVMASRAWRPDAATSM